MSQAFAFLYVARLVSRGRSAPFSDGSRQYVGGASCTHLRALSSDLTSALSLRQKTPERGNRMVYVFLADVQVGDQSQPGAAIGQHPLLLQVR